MSMAEKFGNFAFGDITFYDKESFDKVMDEFKKRYGKNIDSIDKKRCKGSGPLGLRTKEERRKLGYLSINLESGDNGTMSIYGYGHRQGIFGLIDFMKHYFNSRDIVAYRGSDNAKRIDDEEFVSDLVNRLEQEQSDDEIIMADRLRDWKNGTLPEPDGRNVEEKEL